MDWLINKVEFLYIDNYFALIMKSKKKIGIIKLYR